MLLTFDACAEFLLIGTAVVLYFENLLYLALVLNFVFYLHCRCVELQKILIFIACAELLFLLALPMCCVLKISHNLCLCWTTSLFALPTSCMLKTSYIWRLWWTASFIWHWRYAAFRKPLVFCSSVEFRLLFGTLDVLHCKNLVFDAGVELSLLFGTFDKLHCKKLLCLTLVLNYVFYLQLPMCCIANNFLCLVIVLTLCLLFGAAKALHVENYVYLALVMKCVFYLALSICCITKKLLYLALVLKYVFYLALPMICIAKIL